MQEQLISFETAKLAKEKGLCEYFENINGTKYVTAFYSEDGVNFEETEFRQEDCTIDDRYFRPTQSLLQKWLREKHIIDVIPSISYFKNGIKGQYVSVIIKPHFESEYYYADTYEEALEKGLQEALKLIKNV